MDSRINENPERTFDLVLQVACPSSENEDPTVLWKFPQDFRDQQVLQTVPKFCFPFDVERVSKNQVGQNFTFVLTDIESKQRFGFCRLTSGCKMCICLLSYLPWFEIFYKLLNTLADYLMKRQESDLNDMLETLYELAVPKPNTPVSLSVHSYFIVPDINGLPTIPESRNLTEYFVAVDVTNMLQLYASLLHERRVIITSSKLSTLTACVHGAATMLFPMHWQHIYIPVLPPHLLDYCCAPMPYLIGVHLSLLERVKSRSLEDVVILNVDTNTIESSIDDLHNLPSDVVSSLKSKLKKQSTATGSGVARAFLRSQAALFGSYRDALRYKPGEPITFCEDSFVAHRSSTMRSFLEMAVNLQLFKQFIDDRLAKLNAGRGFTDIFEEEITEGGFCGSNSWSYQQWMHSVKKGVNKASPAVKSAYKIAKVRARKGLWGVKDRIRHKEAEEEDGLCRADSPTSTKSLSPRRLQKRRHERQKSPMSMGFPEYVIDGEDELDTASKISSEDSGEMPSYTEDSDDSYELEPETKEAGQMNLLEEILDSLNTTSIEQGKLSAAKSLDFFRSMDDLDCSLSNNAKSPSASGPGQGSSVVGVGGGEPSGRNMVQDDSIVHGKHLPPSPRRQCSTRSWSAPITKPSKELAGTELPQLSQRSSHPDPLLQPPVSEVAKATEPPTQPDSPLDPQPNPDGQRPATCGVLRRKVLSRETLRHFQERSQQGGACPSNRHPSVLVPWEKEQEGHGEGTQEHQEKLGVQEKGLLEEIEAVCRLSMAMNSSLQLAQVHNNAGLDKS
ncbi:DENN domain-containing protein 1B isoform X2 [Electrophorus electricus]|uniref:DENN domain-containing protein 1B isoform X2 n=1 Tax=Electrophorus electricus TaxID=8005 RepID=UPI0015CF88F9|nr:DENN domain-containing protein 1B isoform X2 [Electrophorus electricus]